MEKLNFIIHYNNVLLEAKNFSSILKNLCKIKNIISIFDFKVNSPILFFQRFFLLHALSFHSTFLFKTKQGKTKEKSHKIFKLFHLLFLNRNG